MTSVGLRFRLRHATLYETDGIGTAPIGDFEPGQGAREVAFRFTIRGASTR